MTILGYVRAICAIILYSIYTLILCIKFFIDLIIDNIKGDK
jgi:hypothetical protein